jgi:hypothetical protein
MLCKTLIIIALHNILCKVCWLWQQMKLRVVSQNDTEYLSTVTQLCMPCIIKRCKHYVGRITIVTATLIVETLFVYTLCIFTA